MSVFLTVCIVFKLRFQHCVCTGGNKKYKMMGEKGKSIFLQKYLFQCCVASKTVFFKNDMMQYDFYCLFVFLLPYGGVSKGSLCLTDVHIIASQVLRSSTHCVRRGRSPPELSVVNPHGNAHPSSHYRAADRQFISLVLLTVTFFMGCVIRFVFHLSWILTFHCSI